MKKLSLLILILTASLLCSSCSRPQFNQIHKRFSKSLSLSSHSALNSIDTPGNNQFSFAIFGDTHMGSPLGNILSEAIDSAVSKGADFVIVSGDLTDTGKSRQFDDFKKEFTDRGIEFRAALGNHDIYFDGWENFVSKIGPASFQFKAENIEFFFLDSANGVIGKSQLNWLEKGLSESSSTLKMIVTHYSPYVGTHQSLWRLSSDEESAILKDIAYRYQVDLLIAGHLHGYKQKQIGVTQYLVSGGVNKLTDPGEERHYTMVYIDGANIRLEKVNL